jgi:hypothetical protein
MIHRVLKASSYKEAVNEAGIPSAATESADIRSSQFSPLRTISDDFLGAATSLTNAPAPSGGTSEQNGLRLALMVDSEAARAAEAARIAKTRSAETELGNVAKTLAIIGDDLWDPDLGVRSVTFDPSLLVHVGP